MDNRVPAAEASGSELPEPQESVPEFTSGNILEFPWNLWRYLRGADAFFRRKLARSVYYTLLLRLFRRNIGSELSKKRSRKGAAVKRAYRYSRTDAKKIADSLDSLDLNQLWSTLDESSSAESKSLNQRLDAILSKNISTILKTEPVGSSVPLDEPGSEDDSAESEDADTREESAGILWKSPKEQDEEPSDRTEGGLAGLEDRFFKLDEMEAFANEELGSGDDIDYFDSLGEESDGSVAAAEMKFSDFFRDPEESEGEEPEDFKPLTCDRGLDDLDEYDREMELMLQKLEDEAGDGVEEEGEMYRDEIEDFEVPEEPEGSDREYYDTLESGEGAEEDELSRRITEVEKELVAPRHWSLMGESSAKNRPRNSLLDLELELPRPASTIHASEQPQDAGQAPESGEGAEEELPLELIITQRIKSGVFDNVERKYFLEDQMQAAEQLKKAKADPREEIDFGKSELGLGEVYAQKYRDQFMAIDKLDAHKKDLSEQFARLVYKLDALSNSSFVPRRVGESEKASSAPVVSVDTPLNVVVSEGPAAKPEQPPPKLSRSAKKRKFKNKIKGLVSSGRLTPQQAQEMRAKMQERNKKRASDLRSKKATGLTAAEAARHELKSSRRLDTKQLLCNIET